MTCDKCREAGDHNRRVYDSGVPNVDDLYIYHPENCECTCGHEYPAEWEKMFRIPQPSKETEDK